MGRAQYQRTQSEMIAGRKLLAGPACGVCGGATRIVSIAPHKRFKRRHVWTLECTACGTGQAAEMPAPQRVH